MLSAFGVGSVYVRVTVGFGVGFSRGGFARESDSDLFMPTTGFFVGTGLRVGTGLLVELEEGDA